MEWPRNFGRKKKDSKSGPHFVQTPSQTAVKLDDPEMEKLLGLFMRTCWPSNYGEFSLGVDTEALRELKGPYLTKAKAAVLDSLEKSPHVNSIIAASAIEMTEAIPFMNRWIQHIRSLDDKSKSYLAYSKLAHALYNFTKDDAYLTDLAEAVRASGSGDLSDTNVFHSLWRVPLTIDIFSAVWEKLKKRTKIDESSSWPQACEDFLRDKLADPVGQVFLETLSETEQQEIRSIVATTKMQKIERNRRFERFVVDRYAKSDLNKYGEYIKVGGSPVPGLTLQCILEGHTKKVKSSAWSPDGFLLASAGSDNIVVVWDVKKGDFISIIEGREIDRSRFTSGSDWDYNIWHVAWSTNGEWVAFGAEKKNVSIWDVKKGAFVIPPERDGGTVRDLAWASGHNSLLFSLPDETVWIRNVSSGKVRQIFQGYGGRFDSLAWSSDAKFIAAGYWDLKKHGNANRGAEEPQSEILLWDVKNEKVVTRMACHLGYINHISWMPILAAASNDHTVSIWDMQERRRIASLESHASSISGVSFSAGGVLLASTAERDEMVGGTVRLWRTDTWEELIILKELESAGGVLAFHPTLPLLATRCHANPPQNSGNSSASCIRIWELDFDTFLRNPPFMDEFHRIEADFLKQG
jgi:WD40 repeat protein